MNAARGPSALELIASAQAEANRAALPETQIFQRGQFTFNRRFLEVVRANYPGDGQRVANALRQRVEGTVELNILVDERGVVTEAKIVSGTGGRLGLDEAAVEHRFFAVAGAPLQIPAAFVEAGVPRLTQRIPADVGIDAPLGQRRQVLLAVIARVGADHRRRRAPCRRRVHR